MTPEHPFYSQPGTFQRSVLLYGLNGIFGTGGIIPAGGRLERRYHSPVKKDDPDKEFIRELFHPDRIYFMDRMTA
jgi:hypothetical protein